ncbi:hypothetical protein AB833_11720 [Chromatiales bacterium (ex Bugula neritina AB1)]|nr:hypothetical protein AB833_11720 [Chromatiales bacterium (ex Bugula neritina AB1)]
MSRILSCLPVVGSLCAIVLVLCGSIPTSAYADSSCTRLGAYWHTNLAKLVENTGDCNASAWHKCSQAAAIHYDLTKGSLAQRARNCGYDISAPLPGHNYMKATENDTQQCLNAREALRRVFADRAQARLACAAAREGGDNQEWLDAQCKMHRGKMANYHAPFRVLEAQCKVAYKQTLANAALSLHE